MLENMTTGEKALIGATAIGIAALVFHKPTRNAVGLSDGKENKKYETKDNLMLSSGSVDGAAKMLNNFWYRDDIYLKPTDDPKYFDVYDRDGLAAKKDMKIIAKKDKGRVKVYMAFVK
jgi:hypothetical protein